MSAAPVRALVVGTVIALATIAGGWSGVPLAAFLWGAWRRREADAAPVAGIGAILAWGGLLVWQATLGPVMRVADRLAGVFGAPGPVLVLASLVLAFGLAWSAAEVGSGAMRLATGEMRRA